MRINDCPSADTLQRVDKALLIIKNKIAYYTKVSIVYIYTKLPF